MQAPKQIEPTKLADYLEVLTKAVFQSGMGWRVIEAKWDGFRVAFTDFDPATVAGRLRCHRRRPARRVPLPRRHWFVLLPLRGR